MPGSSQKYISIIQSQSKAQWDFSLANLKYLAKLMWNSSTEAVSKIKKFLNYKSCAVYTITITILR